ncbi:putative glycosyl transferase FCK3 [Colletotrichum orbiculare MAFF 240422]|uniref:Glycosyl transferase FCK3 n=1 Tax=Colletotrichum orbiculare (strain 104-T / ATCC 96160 / CBS 514.97 / LARS 414 / MAFF 240422) TaxID=1213857 RepID=A0A484FDN6_COLOR|nr:putative glycosyl transferase FCK3 [Colletotrichum orbiculare MAFF 240422]
MTVTATASSTAQSPYPIPKGLSPIPLDELDLRPDAEVDGIINNPPPVSSNKNIWFFWNTGYDNAYPYAQRNVRAWHRRLSRKGWVVRVVDLEPDSPGYIGKWLDLRDPSVVPDAFRDGTLDGEFAKQHYSDLVRFPLLVKYGGVYTDVGFMQIGDLDRLWNETVQNPNSPYEVLSMNQGGPREYGLTNYFIASASGNPFWQACHELLLKVWEGRTNTEGLHSHPLLKGLPLMGQSFDTALSQKLSDYIIQGQVITMVMSTVDEERGWDGPKYVSEKIYAPEYMVGSQLINEYTNWNGVRAFELMSQRMPKAGEPESDDQKLARTIVEDCFQRSFSFKLAHGLILQVLGETLGSLWRKHTGSDDVEGTYAHWLRYGMVRWKPNHLPEREPYEKLEPVKRGPLLREG